MTLEGGQRVSIERRFYTAMAVFMTVIVFIGFWPTYFSLLVTRQEFERDWVVHIHAVISLLWMGLLIFQTRQIAQGRVATHMRIGPYGFGLGVVVVLAGYFVALRGMGRFVSAGVVTWPEAIIRAPSPLASITTFALLAGIGAVL